MESPIGTDQEVLNFLPVERAKGKTKSLVSGLVTKNYKATKEDLPKWKKRKNF